MAATAVAPAPRKTAAATLLPLVAKAGWSAFVLGASAVSLVHWTRLGLRNLRKKKK